MKLQLLFFSKYGKIFLIALLLGKLKRSTEVQQWFLLNGWLDYIVLSIDPPSGGLMAGWYITFWKHFNEKTLLSDANFSFITPFLLNEKRKAVALL